MKNVVTHWNNSGWESDSETQIMVHGSAFHGDKLLRGRQLATVFGEAEPGPDAWVDLLSQCNGFFAIARYSTSATLVAVDRVRSIPVFYGQQGGTVFISDEADWVRQRVGDTEMEPVAREEFQLAGYVTGSDTLYPNVKQLQAGELLHIVDGEQTELTTHRWYRFTHSEPEHWSEAKLRDGLEQVAESSIRRLAEYAAGRQIVVPLSGGYDSRLIASLLKRIGYHNILTFTYGVPGNKQSKYSRRVAEALSVPWHFVEYTESKWREAWQTDERFAFQRWSSGWASLPHVQDWLAVRQLKADGIIAEDVVFCPGHTGDFIAGGHIPDDFTLGQPVGSLDVIRSVFKNHLSLAPWDLITNRAETYWSGRVADRAEAGTIATASAAVDAYEKWEWQERQAKFIVNSVRVYEFYGHDWWLPLWDAEFVSFWQEVPLYLRKGKKWYTGYVRGLGAAHGAHPNRSASDRSFILAWAKVIVGKQAIRMLSSRWQRLKGRTHVCMPYARFEQELIDDLFKKGYRFNGVEAFVFLSEMSRNEFN